MNERIQQLAEQARIKDHWSIDEGRYLTNYLDEKKFAQLIIQDCMDVVDGYTKPRTFNTHYDAVEQIEALFGIKHFGVEL
jgi:hypothetical protein